ncbi:hypothetical protein QJQ45_010480 [Haematococcus lacustris]|nr:hypothetical protein QJQ45_010480 [Haematococcus lacustris]
MSLTLALPKGTSKEHFQKGHFQRALLKDLDSMSLSAAADPDQSGTLNHAEFVSIMGHALVQQSSLGFPGARLLPAGKSSLGFADAVRAIRRKRFVKAMMDGGRARASVLLLHQRLKQGAEAEMSSLRQRLAEYQEELAAVAPASSPQEAALSARHQRDAGALRSMLAQQPTPSRPASAHPPPPPPLPPPPTGHPLRSQQLANPRPLPPTPPLNPPAPHPPTTRPHSAAPQPDAPPLLTLPANRHTARDAPAHVDVTGAEVTPEITPEVTLERVVGCAEGGGPVSNHPLPPPLEALPGPPPLPLALAPPDPLPHSPPPAPTPRDPAHPPPAGLPAPPDDPPPASSGPVPQQLLSLGLGTVTAAARKAKLGHALARLQQTVLGRELPLEPEHAEQLAPPPGSSPFTSLDPRKDSLLVPVLPLSPKQSAGGGGGGEQGLGGRQQPKGGGVAWGQDECMEGPGGGRGAGARHRQARGQARRAAAGEAVPTRLTSEGGEEVQWAAISPLAAHKAQLLQSDKERRLMALAPTLSFSRNRAALGLTSLDASERRQRRLTTRVEAAACSYFARLEKKAAEVVGTGVGPGAWDVDARFAAQQRRSFSQAPPPHTPHPQDAWMRASCPTPSWQGRPGRTPPPATSSPAPSTSPPGNCTASWPSLHKEGGQHTHPPPSPSPNRHPPTPPSPSPNRRPPTPPGPSLTLHPPHPHTPTHAHAPHTPLTPRLTHGSHPPSPPPHQPMPETHNPAAAGGHSSSTQPQAPLVAPPRSVLSRRCSSSSSGEAATAPATPEVSQHSSALGAGGPGPPRPPLAPHYLDSSSAGAPSSPHSTMGQRHALRTMPSPPRPDPPPCTPPGRSWQTAAPTAWLAPAPAPAPASGPPAPAPASGPPAPGPPAPAAASRQGSGDTGSDRPAAPPHSLPHPPTSSPTVPPCPLLRAHRLPLAAVGLLAPQLGAPVWGAGEGPGGGAGGGHADSEHGGGGRGAGGQSGEGKGGVGGSRTAAATVAPAWTLPPAFHPSHAETQPGQQGGMAARGAAGAQLQGSAPTVDVGGAFALIPSSRAPRWFSASGGRQAGGNAKQHSHPYWSMSQLPKAGPLSAALGCSVPGSLAWAQMNAVVQHPERPATSPAAGSPRRHQGQLAIAAQAAAGGQPPWKALHAAAYRLEQEKSRGLLRSA